MGHTTVLLVACVALLCGAVGHAVACPAGTRLVSSSCTPCEPGSFAQGTDSTECALCPAGFFSSRGATNCSAAPIGYVVPVAGGALQPCNVGTSTAAVASTTCTQCPSPEVCEGAGVCADGSIGTLCGRCAENHMDIGHSCVTCPPAWWLSIVAGILFQKLLSNLVQAGKWTGVHGALVVGFVTFTQTTHLQVMNHVPWPAWARQVLIWISWSIGDLGGIHPAECGTPQTSWQTSFWLVVGFSAFTLVGPLTKRWMLLRRISVGAWVVQRLPQRLQFKALTGAPVQDPDAVAHATGHQWASLVLMLYVPVLKMVLTTVLCVSTPVGEFMLVDTDLLCASSMAVVYRVLASLVLCTLFAFPGVLLWYYLPCRTCGRRKDTQPPALIAAFALSFRTDAHASVEALLVLKRAILVWLTLGVMNPRIQIGFALTLAVAHALLLYRTSPWVRCDSHAVPRILLASAAAEAVMAACGIAVLLNGGSQLASTLAISIVIAFCGAFVFVLARISWPRRPKQPDATEPTPDATQQYIQIME